MMPTLARPLATAAALAAALALGGTAAQAQDAVDSDAIVVDGDSATTPTGSTMPPVSELIEVESDERIVAAFGLTVDQVEDLDVVGPDGEVIGEVDEVLQTREGEIVAITVEVGGFLGIGSREVVIALDEVTHDANRLHVGLTRDQIEALDDWTD